LGVPGGCVRLTVKLQCYIRANARALGRADDALGFIKQVKGTRSCNVRSQSAAPAPIPDGCVTDGGVLHVACRLVIQIHRMIMHTNTSKPYSPSAAAPRTPSPCPQPQRVTEETSRSQTVLRGRRRKDRRGSRVSS
jgi:hypothetical protein